MSTYFTFVKLCAFPPPPLYTYANQIYQLASLPAVILQQNHGNHEIRFEFEICQHHTVVDIFVVSISWLLMVLPCTQSDRSYSILKTVTRSTVIFSNHIFMRFTSLAHHYLHSHQVTIIYTCNSRRMYWTVGAVYVNITRNDVWSYSLSEKQPKKCADFLHDTDVCQRQIINSIRISKKQEKNS